MATVVNWSCWLCCEHAHTNVDTVEWNETEQYGPGEGPVIAKHSEVFATQHDVSHNPVGRTSGVWSSTRTFLWFPVRRECLPPGP